MLSSALGTIRHRAAGKRCRAHVDDGTLPDCDLPSLFAVCDVGSQTLNEPF
jgi:hypothetical protein